MINVNANLRYKNQSFYELDKESRKKLARNKSRANRHLKCNYSLNIGGLVAALELAKCQVRATFPI